MLSSPIVSCDSHVSEPEDLWTSRLPEDDRYRAPIYGRTQQDKKKIYRINGKIVSITDEYQRFYRDGRLVAVNPRVVPDDVTAEPIERDDLAGRLLDMAADGVSAETMHPNVGQFIYDIEDPQFSMLCAQIYNDYVIERYTDPRLVPNALVPVRDIDLAVREIERAASLGFRGIELPIFSPASQPYFLSVYEPVWAAASAHGLPIAFHAGSGTGIDFVNRSVAWPADAGDFDRAAVAMKTTSGGFQGNAGVCTVTVPALISAGVPERYPNVHFLFIETGARWLALLMDNMDCAWTGVTVDREVQRLFFKSDGSPAPQFPDAFFEAEWQYPLAPSDYVKRQFHFGFMDDPLALRNREITGIEPLVWGSDYPHYEGTWPNSRAAIEAMLQQHSLTDAEAAAIFGGTLAKVYGITVPAAA